MRWGRRVPPEGGDVTESRGFLWAAGLCLRRAALDGCGTAGFSPMLMAPRRPASLRRGRRVVFALRIAGWRSGMSRLRLKHRIVQTRLSWRYCASGRAGRGSSISSILSFCPVRFNRRTAPTSGSALVVARVGGRGNMTQQRLAHVMTLPSTVQGDSRELVANRELGRASALLRSRGAYAEGFERVAQLKARLDSSAHSGEMVTGLSSVASRRSW